MALGVSGEIAGQNVFDASCIHVSGANKSGCDEVAEPVSRELVVFVVIRTQGARAALVEVVIILIPLLVRRSRFMPRMERTSQAAMSGDYGKVNCSYGTRLHKRSAEDGGERIDLSIRGATPVSFTA